MKKIAVALIVLALGSFAVYWFGFRNRQNENNGPKQAPVIASIHSAAFNSSIDLMMNAYFEIKNAFVNADTTKAKLACKQFLGLLDSIKTDELKKDSALILQAVTMQIGDIRANAESLLLQKDITEMRQDFRMISENVYPFLKTIHYSGKKLYWDNCPMAFGEGKEANWISNTDEVINPYLGKFHPEYKATMLHCGEIKDSIISQ